VKKKISIITVVLNRENTIGSAIVSLNNQDYENIEHVIIDGGSSDNTLKIIETHRSPYSVLHSALDEGIYDALNRGILLSTGEVIGILHSDDSYAHPQVLSSIMDYFNDTTLDAVYGDAKYINSFGEVVRHYSSSRFSVYKIKYGEIMAHTALFIRKQIYIDFGLYDKSYKIAGDFEFVARVFSKKIISYKYMNAALVNMNTGGISNRSILSRVKTSIEIKKACLQNGISTNYFKLSLRYFYKIFEYTSAKKY
jgi:glycosyltransferase involved in cell wall biosynthesis